jgi:hypothetical protein
MYLSIKQAPSSETSTDSEDNDSTSDVEWDLFAEDIDWYNKSTVLECCDVEWDDEIPINGLHWEFNGSITNSPSNKMAPKNTTL